MCYARSFWLEDFALNGKAKTTYNLIVKNIRDKWTKLDASQKGLRLTEVPVSAIYPGDTSTQNPVRHGIEVLGRIVNMISERRPLLFFGVAGTISCLLGILAGVRVLTAMASSAALPIGTALLSAVFLIVGVFSVFTGIVLNILSRTMRTQK